MNIGIVTCTTQNRKWLYDITNPSKKKYANLYNYDYIFSDTFYPDTTKGVYWLKPAFIAQHITNKYDWILWLDDDAGIIKFDFNIEQFIKSVEEADKDIYAAEDLNGLNAGVLLVRSTDNARKIFDFIYNKMEPIYKTATFQDQSALIKIATELNTLKLVDGHVFNAYNRSLTISPKNQQTNDTFILHIAGGDAFKQANLNKIKTLFTE